MVVLIGFFWLLLDMVWVKSYFSLFSVSKYSITCVECLNLKFPRIRGEMKTWCLFLFHLFRTWIKLLSRFVPRETILKDQQIEVPEASIVVTWAAAAIVANIVFSCQSFFLNQYVRVNCILFSYEWFSAVFFRIVYIVTSFAWNLSSIFFSYKNSRKGTRN